MTTVSNSYSTGHNCNLCSKPSNETKTEDKKDQSLWESFCNEVIAPAIEDAAYSYIDNNYGTNLAEQKQQKELEEAYEKAISDAENMDTFTGALIQDGVNELYKYADKQLGTNFVELNNEQKEKDAAFLAEAKEYQAQKEQEQSAQQQTQQESGGITLLDLFNLFFGSKN